jgi:hypothetical protein
MDEDIDCKDCWKRALEKEYAEVDEWDFYITYYIVLKIVQMKIWIGLKIRKQLVGSAVEYILIFKYN